MASVLVAYATKHGQTAKIAESIARTLASRGHSPLVRECDAVTGDDVARSDAVVLGGPIYIVRTSRALRRLAVRERAAIAARPTFLFTVCMSEAGTDEAAKADVRRIVAAMLAKTGLRVTDSVVFAGALNYTAYGPLMRFIMKRISAKEGGNTDTSRDWEYTDWAQVEAFAGRIAERLDARPAEARSERA